MGTAPRRGSRRCEICCWAVRGHSPKSTCTLVSRSRNSASVVKLGPRGPGQDIFTQDPRGKRKDTAILAQPEPRAMVIGIGASCKGKTQNRGPEFGSPLREPPTAANLKGVKRPTHRHCRARTAQKILHSHHQRTAAWLLAVSGVVHRRVHPRRGRGLHPRWPAPPRISPRDPSHEAL